MTVHKNSMCFSHLTFYSKYDLSNLDESSYMLSPFTLKTKTKQYKNNLFIITDEKKLLQSIVWNIDKNKPNASEFQRNMVSFIGRMVS